MERYEKYKESGVQWLGEVPEHWGVTKLSSLAKEKKVRNSGNLESNVLSLSYGNIIRKKDINFGLVPADYSTYQIVEKGDIILRLTDLQNDYKSLRTGLVKERGIITSAYLCLSAKCNSSFLQLLLHSYDCRKVFYGLGGGLRQSMNYADMAKLYIPLPPLPEQRAIVSFLDTKTSEIDTFIADKEKQISLLQEAKQTIIADAVTKGINPNVAMNYSASREQNDACINSAEAQPVMERKFKDSGISWIGEIPEHWDILRFKNIVQLVKEPAKSYDKKVALENIAGFTGKYLETETIFEGEGTHFEVNDILFGKLRPYLSKVYKAEFDGQAVGDFYVFRANKIIDSGYLQKLTISSHFIGVVNAGTYGAKMPRASWNDIANLKVPLPPLPEQRAIVAYLEEKTTAIDTLIADLQREIEGMKEYKQRLISDVVTGQIKVC